MIDMRNELKNIFIGMGSTLVIMPLSTVGQISPPQKNDAENLAGDWQQVGHDLRTAMGQVDNEQKK